MKGFSRTQIKKRFIRWDPDYIIQTLFISNFTNKLLRDDLNEMRGIRNNLFHGNIDNPTQGNANKCLTLANKMVELINQLSVKREKQQRDVLS